MIASSPAIWLLCGQYFACSYAWYFFVTWFPTYLLEVHRFDLKQSALLAGLPLFLGGFGSLFSGWFTPHLQTTDRRRRLTRRLVGVVGLLGAATCLFMATRLQQPILAVLAIAAASFCNDVTMPGVVDRLHGGRRSLRGHCRGHDEHDWELRRVFSPVVLGYIVGRTGDWNLTFYVTGGLYVLGAIAGGPSIR